MISLQAWLQENSYYFWITYKNCNPLVGHNYRLVTPGLVHKDKEEVYGTNNGYEECLL
jgi:hypothetical protein